MLQCIHEANLSFCRWEVTVSSMAKSGWALTCALSDRALGRRQVAPNSCRAIALRSNGTIDPGAPFWPAQDTRHVEVRAGRVAPKHIAPVDANATSAWGTTPVRHD